MHENVGRHNVSAGQLVDLLDALNGEDSFQIQQGVSERRHLLSANCVKLWDRFCTKLYDLHFHALSGKSDKKRNDSDRNPLAADSEPRKWRVGQLVGAKAQNSSVRAGCERCHVKTVQPNGRTVHSAVCGRGL